MQANTPNFQDAIARAREIAQKLTATAPNIGGNLSLKRSNNDEDFSNKRPALTSSTDINDVSSPVLRAQLVAQKINSQLGVKPSGDSALVPLSNQTTFQEDYKVPDQFVGLVIGKGGEQIIRLQAESGCKVQISQIKPEPVPGGPNPPDRIANMCGTRDAIERAKRIMDDILSKGRMSEGGSLGLTSYSLGGANSKTFDLPLPSAKCGLVIGKGGETIRRLSEEFGVKMYVTPDTTDIDGIEHKSLRIIGDADRVERAKQYVLDSILKPGGSSNRQGGNQSNNTSFNDYGSRTSGTPITGPCNEAIYHVAYEKAGIIIGKGGESIKEINRKSGAFVELDKTYMANAGSMAERVFKLRGTPEQIVTAQQLMFDKVANSPGGTGDLLTPIQFQQQFNLPTVGSNVIDSWNNNNNDPYSNGAASNDPYSQWMSAYGQWPQMGGYDDSSSKNNNGSTADATGMGQMDPAWLAYYQSMNYYNMMQSSMAGAAATANPSTDTSATKTSDSTASTTTNSTTGQADYSQQWIEYYRSVGQNDLADQIAQKMKETGSSTTPTNTSATNSAAAAAQATAMMMSASSPWAPYAHQWAGATAAASNTTNGSGSSTAPST